MPARGTKQGTRGVPLRQAQAARKSARGEAVSGEGAVKPARAAISHVPGGGSSYDASLRASRARVPGDTPSMAKIVLAFSGGLDTSFCAIWLREKTGAEIVTACVDTGGFAPGELEKVEARAR